MNREERERMVDRMLDKALAARSVEPRAGMEERILANLRAQPERRVWWRWMWAPALAAAVVVIAAVGLYFARRTHVPAPPHVAQQQPAKERRDAETQNGIDRQPLVYPPRHAQSKVVRRVPRPSPVLAGVLARAQSLPRQEVFPSPTPLTPEEKMLLALVRGNRPEAVNVAQMQESERERVQKYMETGEAPEPLPAPQPAQPMR